MTSKVKQQQKSSKRKQVITESESSWPDFPPQLVDLVGRHPILEKNIYFGGVIKSWRLAPRHCSSFNRSTSAWLQVCDPDVNNEHCNGGSSFSTSRLVVYGCWNKYFWRRLPRYLWQDYVGCSGGILVARAAPPYFYNLWDPIERAWFHLPTWDPKIPFKLAVLSASPKEKDWMVMVLTGISHPAFMFYRKKGPFEGNHEWTKQDCTLTEPYSSQLSGKAHYMQFSNAIGFKGKIYALTLQGTLAVIEDTDPCPTITALGSTRAIPSVSSCHFREYLLEFNGEILLVFLIAIKSSLNTVDDVEVYRLDFARLAWIKLESLGERALFVGTNCSMCVFASKVGCQRNCVYYRYPKHGGGYWWIYDMNSSSILANSTGKSFLLGEQMEEDDNIMHTVNSCQQYCSTNVWQK